MKIPISSSSSIIFATLAVSSSSTSLAAPIEPSMGGLTPSTSNQNIASRSSPVPAISFRSADDTTDDPPSKDLVQLLKDTTDTIRRETPPTESQSSPSSHLAPTSPTGTLNPSATPMATPANTPSNTPHLPPRAYADQVPGNMPDGPAPTEGSPTSVPNPADGSIPPASVSSPPSDISPPPSGPSRRDTAPPAADNTLPSPAAAASPVAPKAPAAVPDSLPAGTPKPGGVPPFPAADPIPRDIIPTKDDGSSVPPAGTASGAPATSADASMPAPPAGAPSSSVPAGVSAPSGIPGSPSGSSPASGATSA